MFRASLFCLLGLLAFSAVAACPRIVSQSPYITHQLDWLKLKPCIVGASRYDTQLKTANTGGVLDPDGAAIAAIKPDLVITSVWTPVEALAAATPPGARALRLESSQHMEQIEDNLREIGQAAGVADAEARAAAFAHLWRKKAAAVGARGERVLLLSSCTGRPYSFGRNTWLGELFSAAGFTLAEESEGVRRLPAGQVERASDKLVAQMRPDLVFIFNRRIASACATVPLPPGAEIVAMDGDLFLHPAPVLLDGLDVLAQEMRKRYHQDHP